MYTHTRIHIHIYKTQALMGSRQEKGPRSPTANPMHKAALPKCPLPAHLPLTLTKGDNL